jgi:hypothetical protein
MLTKTNVEAISVETCADCGVRVGVRAVGMVERLKSGSPTKPEGTERAEDDEGEGIAENPLN